MLGAEVLSTSPAARAVWSADGSSWVQWEDKHGVLKLSSGGSAQLPASPSQVLAGATLDGKKVCAAVAAGGLSLLVDGGAEVCVVAGVRVERVGALASGLLLETSDGLVGLSHALDAPLPVARLSKSGRADVFGASTKLVCSGGTTAVTWDSATRKHAVYAVYADSERGVQQSYAKAVEESFLVESAQSFFANQISLYDTFTLGPQTETLEEAQLYLRRLLIDSESTDRAECGLVSVSQGLVYLRTGRRLKCFKLGHDGLSCRFLFDVDDVVSFAPLGKHAFWVCCRAGSLWLYDAERCVAQIELPPGKGMSGKGNAGKSMSSAMSMSFDASSDMDEGNSNVSMDCSPATPAIVGGGKSDVHLKEDVSAGSEFVLEGSEGVTRFSLSLFARDPFVAEMMELIRELLPGSAAMDFLVDFGETELHCAEVSEWDRLASLIGTLVSRNPLGNNGDDDDEATQSASSWQRTVSASRFAQLSGRLPAEVVAKCASVFKVLPLEWKDVNFRLATPTTLFRELSFPVLQKLHLYYEGCKGDLALSVRASLLRPLLVLLSRSCGAAKYTAHYVLDDPSLARMARSVPENEGPHNPDAARSTPFHLFRWLIASVHEEKEKLPLLLDWWCGPLEASLPMPLLKVVELWTLRFGSSHAVDAVKRAIHVRSKHRSSRPPLLHGCELLLEDSFSDSDAKKTSSLSSEMSLEEALRSCKSASQLACCYFGLVDDWSLDRLPVAIRVVMQTALIETRVFGPNASWPRRLLELIGRLDMALQKNPPEIGGSSLSGGVQLWGDPELRENERSAGVLITDRIAHLRFPHDRRLEEAQRLLGTWSKMTVSVPQPPAMSDHDYLDAQHRVAILHVVACGARCVGRGMFAFSADNHHCSSGEQSDDDKWQIHVPVIPRSVRVAETRSSVTIDESGPNVGAMDWLDFHSGVAAGLRVAARGGPAISNAWIVYNRPAEGAPASEVFSHAGMLFGLGLNGHLKNLTFVRLFDYLARSHVMTSVGLLLGISATMIGSMDNAITKLLSVHLPLLHPPASADLEVPPSLQVASLMGLGLLYKGSCHRRMAEIMMAEIDRPPTDDKTFHRESHSLTAGLALGWITLGQGGKAATLDDLLLEDRLMRFIVGGARFCEPAWVTDGYAFQEHAASTHAQNPRSNLVKPGSHTNTNLTAAPAMLALGLMFLKTNNVDVAERLKVPDTMFLLGLVRPDFLLLRCLCRTLVMWDSVAATEEWLRSHVPDYLWRYGDPKTGRNALNSEMADSLPRGRDFVLAVHCKLYCVSGCLLGLGIAKAGTQEAAARVLFLEWIGKLLAYRKTCTESDVLVAETCLSNVCLAASLLMAGSGDLEVMRIVRSLALRVENSVYYGSHMVMGMAMGFLFLGGATWTLSTSNTAVAALVTSLFPVYPCSTVDNLYHLQALRHLWVMAAEPRYVCAIDAKTLAPLPASIRYDQSPDVHFSPAVLPQETSTVTVSSEGHISVTVTDNVRPLMVFLQPLDDGKSVFDVQKWLAPSSLLESVANGWNVALLRACSLLRPHDRLRLALPHPDLLREYVQSGDLPNDDCGKAHVLGWALAASGFPPLSVARELMGECTTPFDIAIRTKGRLSYEVCRFLKSV